MKTIQITLLIFAASITSQSFAQESARDIVEKSNDLIRSKSSYVELTLKIVKPDWSREIKMKAWAIEPDYSLVYITAPARDKGTVTLKRKMEV